MLRPSPRALENADPRTLRADMISEDAREAARVECGDGASDGRTALVGRKRFDPRSAVELASFHGHWAGAARSRGRHERERDAAPEKTEQLRKKRFAHQIARSLHAQRVEERCA